MGELATIGDVAAITGVPVKTIRYYADIGLLPPARTTESRYRLYSPREIWRLELIRTLRQVGFGLDEIRRLLTGEVEVATAIDWQLQALETEIAQLARRRDLLVQARNQARVAALDDAQSLTYLHALGTAVQQSVEARSRLLTEKLQAALGGEVVAPAWVEKSLIDLARRLPADPSPEQAAAWAELVALLNEPETTRVMSAQVAPFWQTMAAGNLDWPTWQRELGEVHQRAEAAVRAGLSPADAEPRAIAQQWAALFARMRGEACDDDFRRRFAAVAPTFMDERSRRVHELMDRAGVAGAGASELESQQLILDGLREVVRRLDNGETSMVGENE